MPNIYKSTKANMSNASWSRLRRLVIIGLFVLSFMLSFQSYRIFKARSSAGLGNHRISLIEQQNPSISDIFQDSNGSGLVPLEAHIMSKCPDARDCLRDLIVPAMERISDKVDFRLSFIGTYVNPLSCAKSWSFLRAALKNFESTGMILHLYR